jgi:hypothetical protein
MKNKLFTVVFVLLLTISSCQKIKKDCDCHSIEQTNNNDKIRFRVCEYLKKRRIERPYSFCNFGINKIDTIYINNRLGCRVSFDCCDIGDAAEIDLQSDSVISYERGVK